MAEHPSTRLILSKLITGTWKDSSKAEITRIANSGRLTVAAGVCGKELQTGGTAWPLSWRIARRRDSGTGRTIPGSAGRKRNRVIGDRRVV